MAFFAFLVILAAFMLAAFFIGELLGKIARVTIFANRLTAEDCNTQLMVVHALECDRRHAKTAKQKSRLDRKIALAKGYWVTMKNAYLRHNPEIEIWE